MLQLFDCMHMLAYHFILMYVLLIKSSCQTQSRFLFFLHLAAPPPYSQVCIYVSIQVTE